MKPFIILIFLLNTLFAGNLDSLAIGEVSEYRAMNSKSVLPALCWSLGATIIPVAVGLNLGGLPGGTGIAFGLIAGPSFGHFYAQQWGRGYASTLTRIGLIGVGIGLVYVTTSNDEGPLEEHFDEILGALTIPYVAYLGTMLFDFLTLPNSVNKYNKAQEKTGKLHLNPMLDSQNKKYGLSLRYNF